MGLGSTWWLLSQTVTTMTSYRYGHPGHLNPDGDVDKWGPTISEIATCLDSMLPIMTQVDVKLRQVYFSEQP